MQMMPIIRPEDCAASGGEHAIHICREGIKNLFFDISKTRLTLAVKKLTNRATDTRLNGVIRIYERNAQAARQLTPHCGLP
ncbi:hypothetical protein AEP_03398 [Curvibacter sp. AEP1-3]|nr:hypothetical protein AEP_03398 [Curvibacter sp. AEP1-3]